MPVFLPFQGEMFAVYVKGFRDVLLILYFYL